MEDEAKKEPIIFPASIQVGQVFDSVDEILERMKEELRELDLPQVRRPYDIRYKPTKDNIRYAWFSCRYCKACFNVNKNDQQKLVVTKVNHKHLHSSDLNRV